MAIQFGGFPEEGMTFLRQLARNNTREWFQAHKRVYEESVKAPMVELVTALNSALEDFAPEYRVAEPAKAISRINRDTRFSKDKSPYRTNLSVVLPRGGAEKHEVAGFFFSISPDEIEVVGGSYMPEAEQLARIRAAIAKRPPEFRKLITAKALTELMGTLQGEQLQRVPKDFPPDHAAGDLLRYKQFFFRGSVDPTLATTRKLQPELLKRFKVMLPFIEFLDAALGRPAGKGA